MGMSIKTNTGGNNACRNLKKTSKKGDGNLQKLASGYKINSAADDASGMGITEKMRAQITSLETYSDNSENGISLIQTAEGYLGEVHDMLDRMYELCIRAGDGIFEDNERGMIQEEVDQLNDEIDRISDTANFNGNKLFDPNYKWETKKEIKQVIYYQKKTKEPSAPAIGNVIYTSGLPDFITVDPLSAETGTLAQKFNADNKTLNATFLDFSNFTPSKIKDNIGKGFYATCCTCTNHHCIEFTDEETPFSKEQSGEHSILKVSLRGCETGDDVVDRIMEATKMPDGHHELLEDPNNDGTWTQDFIWLRKVDGKLVIHDRDDVSSVQPHKDQKLGLFGGGIPKSSKDPSPEPEDEWEKIVKDEVVETKNLVHADRVITINSGENRTGKINISLPEMSASTLDTKMVNVMDMDSAGKSTDIVKNAINQISMIRANLGAQQNRLDYTINDIDNAAENMSAAKSRIKDADISKEMMEYTQNNVITQSAQSMLAQANTRPQDVLQLLQ